MRATQRSRRVATAAAIALAAGLGGCERIVQNMYEQPKLKAASTSPLWSDGLASRPAPPGAVARALGEPAADASGRRGDAAVRTLDAADLQQTLPAVTPPALLARGQARYAIYCAPCHSPLGDGDGWVVRRGFPRPPSYHEARLRNAPDRHFFDVIGNGYGIMYGYADRVAPADRWAIVAYIRALQLSQHAAIAALPAGVRAPLAAAAPASSEPARQ
jgi:mono/diheme cytochrome c family protein